MMFKIAVMSMPGFLQMDFKADLRLKSKMGEGGGGVIYKSEMLNQEFVSKFKESAVVTKILKRECLFSNHFSMSAWIDF